MKYREFIARVQERTGLEVERAQQTVASFFELLGARLTPAEVRQLAAQLPEELAHPLQLHRDTVAKYSSQEFFERLGHRENMDTEDAMEHSEMIWETLCEAVSEGELDDIRAILPDGYRDIFR